MKRRFIGILLTVCLVMGIVPIGTKQAYANWETRDRDAIQSSIRSSEMKNAEEPTDDRFIKNDLWIETSDNKVYQRYNNKESFVVMFFRHSCFNSNLRKVLVEDWMNTYDMVVYGVDVDEYTIPLFVWDYLGDTPVTLPVICVIENGRVDAYTANDSMNSIHKRIQEYLGIYDQSEINFSRLNSLVFNRYSKQESTVNKFLVFDEPTYDPITDEAKNVVNGLVNDREKLKAIYDWVTENIYYNYDMLNGTAPMLTLAYETYCNKNSVCAGYANLTAEMCIAVGIPCRVVTGFAAGVDTKNTVDKVWELYRKYLNDNDLKAFRDNVRQYENHAWNEAFVDGEWIILDTTWGSNNEIYPSSRGMIKAPHTDAYFDPDFEWFSESHLFWNDYSDAPVIELNKSSYWHRSISDGIPELTPSAAASAVGQTQSADSLRMIWAGELDTSLVNQEITFRLGDDFEKHIIAAYVWDGDKWNRQAAQVVDNGQVSFNFEPIMPVSLIDNTFVHDHIPGDPVKENWISSTCKTTGSYDAVEYCTVCGIELNRVPTIEPTKHKWTDMQWYWDDDYTFAAAIFFCGNCNEYKACEADVIEENETYTAKVTGPDGKEYTDTKVFTPDDFVMGDVTGDSQVTADDLTRLSRHVAKIDEFDEADLLKAADVNGDNQVTADDLTMLSRYVARIISSFDETEAQDPQPQEPVIIESGTFADTSDVYDLLNSFRTDPDNQWYWNPDDTTKTYVTGLGTIARDAELEEVAKIRAKEAWIQYYENGNATHNRLDGTSCFTAYPNGLYGMGENLAWGQGSGEAAIDSWAETNEPYDYQGHRRNMLSTTFNSVGIACFEKDGKICWSMCLGRR